MVLTAEPLAPNPNLLSNQAKEQLPPHIVATKVESICQRFPLALFNEARGKASQVYVVDTVTFSSYVAHYANLIGYPPPIPPSDKNLQIATALNQTPEQLSSQYNTALAAYQAKISKIGSKPGICLPLQSDKSVILSDSPRSKLRGIMSQEIVLAGLCEAVGNSYVLEI